MGTHIMSPGPSLLRHSRVSTSITESVNEMRISNDDMDTLNNIKLGKGTYGFVERSKMRCHTTKEFIFVAIKFGHDRTQQHQLVKEARIMRHLKGHPHCIEIHGIYESPSHGLGVVMEYCDCKSLGDLIPRRDIDYKIDHVVSWMSQLSAAIDYFHSKNELHRDLKVQNLLLTNSYRNLKVADYGTFTPHRDTMQSMHGSPITMAPEIFKQQRYNTKCDIYSVGIIMWQLIARREPYRACDAAALMWNVAACDKRPPELTCHPILSRFYKRCWHGNPDMRPSSAELIQYFAILKKVYPKGDDALVDSITGDAARVPQSQNVILTPMGSTMNSSRHRRTASDQTDKITIKPETPANRPSELSQSRSRPKSVTPTQRSVNQTITSSTPLPNPSANIVQLLKTELKAPLPIAGNEESQRIYNEHQSLVKNLLDADVDLQKMMEKKHQIIQRIAEYLEYKELEQRKKNLEANRLSVLTKIQHQS